MEVGPGVFVSRIDADDWTPDPEVGGDQHVLAAVDGAFVGMSRFVGVADPEPWLVTERETIVGPGRCGPDRDRRRPDALAGGR
jgi:hypothetical protein